MDDVIVNDTEFLSAHWLAEGFPARLGALVREWREQAKSGGSDPLHALLSVSGEYLRAVHEARERGEKDAASVLLDMGSGGGTGSDAGALLAPAHDLLLEKLGLIPDVDEASTAGSGGLEDGAAVAGVIRREELITLQGERELVVPVLAAVTGPAGHYALIVLEAGAAEGVGDLLVEEPEAGAGSTFPGSVGLIAPLRRTSASGSVEPVAGVPRALSELFASDASPRYVLVLAGRWALLTDAARWSEGRYLALDLVTAMERRERTNTGGLARVAGLMSAEVLLPSSEGTTVMESLTQDSTNHAVGVSAELRDGLRRSVEIVAGDIVRAMREAGEEELLADPDVPQDLARQSLRFLYRLLFLLYAEARPELGVLPTASGDYGSGYGMDRLRDLCLEELPDSAVRTHHIHASLDVLFRLVSGDTPSVRQMPVEDLRADLFARSRTPLIDGAEGRARYWLSDAALHEVLRLLLLSAPAGRGVRGVRKRGGWISYANLGINQLGAVYEGLMSYTGVLTTQPMVEVAKGGDASKGSWLVPEVDSGRYAESDIVRVVDSRTGEKRIRRYGKGEFAYRLSGRDRERSASYYTPEVLTQCVVRHSLAELLTPETTAQQILEIRVCEPALGSGAFANETVNQLAEAYLERRQKELGEFIDADQLPVERRRVKAWIALHRVYGVDLNATAVELAEVSMWLNVMQPHLAAPWFGLHLKRGNSLIGARRAVYNLASLRAEKALPSKTVPEDRSLGEVSLGALKAGEVHHFLLPSATWAAVADAKQAKELDPEGAQAMRAWRKTMLKRPDHRREDVLRRDANAALVEAFLKNEVADPQAVGTAGASITTGPGDGTAPRMGSDHTEVDLRGEETASVPDSSLGSAGSGTVIAEALFGEEFQQIDLAEQARSTEERKRRRTEAELRKRTVRRASQEERLTALARRVERLWAIAARRLEVSEREASRRIEVWGLPEALWSEPSTVTRERIEDALADPDSMYQRLRAVMGAWCALSFWPLDKRQDLPDWNEWLATLEDLLGLDFEQTDHSERLVDQAGFDDLDLIERAERAETGMRSVVECHMEHPWLATAQQIVQKEGFFHWELDFAQVFTRGGFDLQIGNPPWVRPTWKDGENLSEADPWFMLEVGAPEEIIAKKRSDALVQSDVRASYIVDVTSSVGVSKVLGSPVEHPTLKGVQSNLYMLFMERAWRSMGCGGVVGLLHPEGCFIESRLTEFRREAYRRLRRHWQFVNGREMFEEVNSTQEFSINIYGSERECSFVHMSDVKTVNVMEKSIELPDDGRPVDFSKEDWILTPCRDRIVNVNIDTLSCWARIFDSSRVSGEVARMAKVYSNSIQEVMVDVSQNSKSMSDYGMKVASGWHEKDAKVKGIILRQKSEPHSWRDVVLQGPHIFVGSAFYKNPRKEGFSKEDYDLWDLESMSDKALPRSNYSRLLPYDDYVAKSEFWGEVSALKYWRFVVRRRNRQFHVRSLRPAMIPPGAAHVHAVHSCAASTCAAPVHANFFDGVACDGGCRIESEGSLATVLACGHFSSLPADFFIKVSGKDDLHPEILGMVPSLLDHPAWRYLLLRTLRLNCLTRDFEPLWKALAPLTDPDDTWTPAFTGWPALAVGRRASAEAPHPAHPEAGEEPIIWDHAGDLGLSTWTMDTPLRSDYERRAAMVETDALGAIMLGLTAEQLCLIYRAQFGVLRKYEHTMWFDSLGRQIAKHHQAYGVHQDKTDYPTLMSYIQDMEEQGLDATTDQPPAAWYEEGPYADFLSRYEAPFIKADREAEMTSAHAEFCRRLSAAGLTDSSGRPLADPSPEHPEGDGQS